MFLVRATTLAYCIAASTAFAFGGSGRSLSGVQRSPVPVAKVQNGFETKKLRMTADDQQNKGGFLKPYYDFRKWQMELIDSKARSNPKFEEAVAGLMQEPGMEKERAEKLAKIAVSDPILYSIERKREASEINQTPLDYSKIGGFFPMEWLMSGDFGWGYNKKKKRLAEEENSLETAEEQ